MNKASSFSYSLDNTILSWWTHLFEMKQGEMSLSLCLFLSHHLISCKFYLLLSQCKIMTQIAAQYEVVYVC